MIMDSVSANGPGLACGSHATQGPHAHVVIAPRWGAGLGMIQDPARWAGLRDHGPLARSKMEIIP